MRTEGKGRCHAREQRPSVAAISNKTKTTERSGKKERKHAVKWKNWHTKCRYKERQRERQKETERLNNCDLSVCDRAASSPLSWPGWRQPRELGCRLSARTTPAHAKNRIRVNARPETNAEIEDTCYCAPTHRYAHYSKSLLL
jgi:hypothetical protein